MTDTNSYKLLPFNFMRLNAGVLVVNMGGDYLLLKKNEFEGFVNKTLSRNNPKYLDLMAKHFLYEDSCELPVQLLATQYRTKKSFLREFTGLHMMVITLRCNHKCKYCQVSSEHADAKKYDMNRQTARKCVDLIFQTPSPYVKIEFQGGEPLLNFKIIKFVVEYAGRVNQKKNKELEFVICTNLTSITDKQLSYCKKKEICISTSLDGPPEIHNHSRVYEDGNGTHDNVATAVKKTRDFLGTDKVDALLTVTKRSLGHFPEIVDEYVDFGFNRLFFRPINPYGLAVKYREELGYNMDEFYDSYRNGLEYIIDLNLKGKFIVEEYARLILTRMLTPFTTGFVDLQSPTGAGIGGVIYDYNGNIFVADEGRMLARKGDMKFLMGTVNDDYMSIFDGQTIHQTVAASCVECLPQCCNCAFYLWCGSDPVRNYATQKDLIGYRPNNEFCRRNMLVMKYLVERVETANAKVLNVLWSWLVGIPPKVIETFGHEE